MLSSDLVQPCSSRRSSAATLTRFSRKTPHVQLVVPRGPAPTNGGGADFSGCHRGGGPSRDNGWEAGN